MGDNLELRPVRKEEFEAVLDVTSLAFGEELTPEDTKARLPAFPFERSLAAYERGRMVAVSAVLSLELTLPGGVTVPMGGVTRISTLPTHRRRGLLRQLMSAQLDDMAARGEILSGLGASEGLIYGRFGYGAAASVAGFSVERVHSAFAGQLAQPGDNRLRILSSKEAAEQLPPIFDSLRPQVPGTVSRPPGMWQTYFADPPSERDGASRMLYVVHENDAGEPDGYAAYRVKEDWKGSTSYNEVRVVEVIAPDAQRYASLWRYLLDTDLARTIACARGRVDEPLRWLLADPRRFAVSELSDFLWLRLLDVPRALEARRYAAAGSLVLEVTDVFPDPSTKRYLLSVDPAATDSALEATPALPAECKTASSSPDLVLGSDTLAAAYLGGVSFATLAAAQRVREVTPGAAIRADSMFLSGTAPFCATEF